VAPERGAGYSSRGHWKVRVLKLADALLTDQNPGVMLRIEPAE
jgi:hypothetical protein